MGSNQIGLADNMQDLLMTNAHSLAFRNWYGRCLQAVCKLLLQTSDTTENEAFGNCSDINSTVALKLAFGLAGRLFEGVLGLN